MPETLEPLRDYLRAAFPEHGMSEEWNRSRNLLVVRLARRTDAGKTETLLVEIASELLESGSVERVRELLEAQDLATLLREHYRVLMSPESIAPLAWKQLAPEVSSVDEASWESFPASDPAPLSSLSRDAPSKDRTP